MYSSWASQVAQLVKNPPANAGDTGDVGLIPGLGRSPGVGQATHSSILAWRIPIDKGAWWATVRGTTEWGHRHNWAHALAHIKISFYSQVFLFVFVFNYALFFTGLIVFTVYWIKSHWWTSLVGCSPESDMTEWLHFHALEKEMATHSSVLAWRIPGTREPGRLPSMGLYRVGHDWSDLAAAATCIYQK